MRARTENPVLSHPWLWSTVRLRLREVRPRKSPRSGTGPWHPAWKLVKSLPMGSPSQDRDAGSNPADGATNLIFVDVFCKGGVTPRQSAKTIFGWRLRSQHQRDR